jgi:hypothetical protein
VEISLSLTADGLAMNQWAIQTLTFAYLARHGEPLAAHSAANMSFVAIVQHTREQGSEDAYFFNRALVQSVIRAAQLVSADLLVVGGVCRFCGCSMKHPCRALQGIDRNLQWTQSGSCCTAPDCLRKAGPAASFARHTFPLDIPPRLSAAGLRTDPAGGEVAP